MHRPTRSLILILLGLIVMAFSAQAQVSRIRPKSLKEMMDAKENLIILDVRTLEEYKEGHIGGALLLPYDQISAATAAKAIGMDKTRTVIVYCRSGRRSEIAAQSLASLGYKKIFDLGAISSWPYGIQKGPPPSP
ncbi:MAG: rhodanese-like domain-containing protein [Spirochaetia bacterium]|nr:rhodanese-like domain-containing protein [Spirochaetia bacterium]